MKKFYKFSLFITCFIFACISFSSCGINTTEDPDFPLYVTYSISVYCDEFNGPDQLLTNINKWVDDNHYAYDEKVNYSTGAPEEFTTSDKMAVEEKYNVFLPKFKTFLEETRTKLANGAYGDAKQQVKAHFIVYCSRLQGQGNTLACDGIDFIYPTQSSAE